MQMNHTEHITGQETASFYLLFIMLEHVESREAIIRI